MLLLEETAHICASFYALDDSTLHTYSRLHAELIIYVEENGHVKVWETFTENSICKDPKVETAWGEVKGARVPGKMEQGLIEVCVWGGGVWIRACFTKGRLCRNLDSNINKDTAIACSRLASVQFLRNCSRTAIFSMKSLIKYCSRMHPEYLHANEALLWNVHYYGHHQVQTSSILAIPFKPLQTASPTLVV